MKHATDSPEVGNYLAALEARLIHLPADQSEEILFGVREHIAEAMARGSQSTAEVIASLGSPDDVLTGYLADTPPPVLQQPIAPPTAPQNYQSSTLWVVATVILLPFGVFLAGIGYLFGLAGLWMGKRWKLWEKIMGTLLFPGGMLGAFYATFMPFWVAPVSVRGDTAEATISNPVLPGMGLIAGVAMMCLPIIVAVYLLVVGLRRGGKQP